MNKNTNTKLIKLIFLLLLTAALLVGCSGKKAEQKADTAAGAIDFYAVTDIKEGQKNIYVILKVLTSQYWQEVIDGVTTAGNELNCNVYVGGPEGEGDWEIQQQMLYTAVDELGADAIVLSPASSSYLTDTLNDIYSRNIPVVLVDTIINNDSFDTCYMTDNLQAGELAAEEMIRELKAAGISEDEDASIALQIPSVSSQTIIDRLAGFNQYWASNAPENWKVLDEVKLNNGDKERAKQNCIDYIDQYADIKGLFGCNNSSTVGFVNGLKEKERHDIVLVGFDYADETEELIASTEYHASTIVQNQYNMGFEGLKTAVVLLDGAPSDYKFVDTGTVVINHGNYKQYEAGEFK